MAMIKIKEQRGKKKNKVKKVISKSNKIKRKREATTAYRRPIVTVALLNLGYNGRGFSSAYRMMP